MASSVALKDLQENFFLCSVCLDQVKEPKLLPCLHRYCRDCLETVIQASTDGTIKCLQCKQQSVLPENGVDGFKTDFHIKSVIEFRQLQTSFETQDLKICMSCLKLMNTSAYCFKCCDFLCEQCYNVHVTSKMFTDHQPRTLRLDNIEAKNITLDKLAALKEDPMCHEHVKTEAHLCCSTCQNIPVCVVCTCNKHRGHDLHDVTELSETERGLLKPKLAELKMYKSKLYELPKKIQTTRDKLDENVARKTEILNSQYEQQAQKITDKLDEQKNVRRKGFLDIENRRKGEEKQNNLDYEEEFNALNKKYHEIREKTTAKYDNECQEFKENCSKIDAELLKKLESLDSNLKSLKTAKEILEEQNKNEMREVSQYCEQIIRRYENITATASSILSSKNQWTEVQSIPDVRAACEPLIEEMKRELIDLESLSDIVIDDITEVIADDVSEPAESVVVIEEIQAKGWGINGVTSNSRGDIVITGCVSKEYSHITVINRKGEVLRQDQIKGERQKQLFQFRYCCFLSEFKVATVCIPNEVGIYDIRVGSYIRKTIHDVIRDWPSGRCVRCVSTDPVNNLIIAGTNSRCVYVLDDQLNYSHTITLPAIIRGSYDITVHGGSLLICDPDGKRAYAVTREGLESSLVYEFTKPDLDGGDWRPWRVCKDKNGFIYVLWDANISGQSRCILVQYSKDGQTLLSTITVDENANCVDVMKMGEQDKIIIATVMSGKLYTYGLYSCID